MAFKTVKSYNEERFNGLFLLRNDGDHADVIFMYRSADDVLVADTHYIKSADFSGYAHCIGRGCPACEKGIRVQTKLFIPLFNIDENELQFWDRSIRFEPQLQDEVFKNYPNPCDYVFRITRHGQPNDVNTTYSIQAIGKNSYKTYAQILVDSNASMPEYYEKVCKDLSVDKMTSILNTSSNSSSYSDSNSMPDYAVSPRKSAYSAQPPEVSLPDVENDVSDTEPSDEEDVNF